jgi:hypothetical protein
LKNDLVAVNLHHFLRRGTNYGPPLPEGVLEDDGVQRGGVFLLIGTHIKRQGLLTVISSVKEQSRTPYWAIVRVTEFSPFLNAHCVAVFTVSHNSLWYAVANIALCQVCRH